MKQKNTLLRWPEKHTKNAPLLCRLSAATIHLEQRKTVEIAVFIAVYSIQY